MSPVVQQPHTVPGDVRSVIESGTLRHIAIIMDGNRRWAKAHHMPTVQGHHHGYKTLKALVEYASRDLKLPALTVYAFSTENWKRSKLEVSFLMRLFRQTLQQEVAEMHAENIRLSFLGDLAGFSPVLQEECHKAEALTANNTGLRFQVAMNYGGRAEIVEACRRVAQQVEDGKLKAKDITPELLSSQLYTGSLMEPDLVIRTSGEYRLSNFLLWQAAYAEIYVDDVFWPDFTPERLNLAIESFANRHRRFGQ